MNKGGSRRILVVDDEYGMAEILSEILTGAGFDTVTASNGAQALERVKDRRPDLVLLDYMMPIMNGPTMFRILRADPENASIPVIMMSAVEESVVRASCPGISGFLRKPFELNALLKVVESVVG